MGPQGRLPAGDLSAGPPSSPAAAWMAASHRLLCDGLRSAARPQERRAAGIAVTRTDLARIALREISQEKSRRS